MRVLMVISQFHPLVGGAEKQAKLLAKKLMEKGIHVNILTGWWKFKTPPKEVIDGIEVFRNFSCWGMFGIRGVRTLGGFMYMLTLCIYLLVHRRDYDIIHVHQALYPAFVSVLVGKQILGKPVLVKTASSGVTSDLKLLRKFPLGRCQSKYLLRKMDFLVSVNKMGGKDLIESGYPESKIIFISNGVEIPKEGVLLRSGVTNVITATRFSVEKGVDILLKAWAAVLREEKKLKLIVLGDGPLKSAMNEMCQSLGVNGSVEFPGMVYNIESYLRYADLFVLPSRTEGMSNALLEAMSYGIPCIATKVGGNGELLGGGDGEILRGGYRTAENGLLTHPDDVKGLSEAILYFVRNQGLREEMGRKSREFVKKNYSIDSIADRYIALYQSMLNKR